MKKTIIITLISLLTTSLSLGVGFWVGKNLNQKTPKEVYSYLYYGSQPDKTTIEACKNDPDYCMDVTSGFEIENEIIKKIKQINK